MPNIMIKERRLTWLGHAVCCVWSKNFFFATRVPGHVQPVGWLCGTRVYYAVRDVSDTGQQIGQGMGNRSLEWNWPKEAMNIPIWARIVLGIVAGAKMF